MRLIELNTLNAADMLDNFLVPRRRKVGHKDVVNYLSDVSREILRSKECRIYPDIVTFGYFCRRSSIERVLKKRTGSGTSFGWGLAVHIAPSNVPVNVAFSFLFGLLAGNNNIVRLPSTSWPQIDLLVSILVTVAGSGSYDGLVRCNAFVRTERNSSELNQFVASCDALIVWGGDHTVSTFRKLDKKPRCVELYFPDRKSSLVVNANRLTQENKDELHNHALSFFNDTYLADNNACSSPRRILWVGPKDNVSYARQKLWSAVNEVIQSKDYDLNVIAKIDKYLDVMASVAVAQAPVSVEKISEDIWLTRREEETLIGRLGRFSESFFETLNKALVSLDDDEQTLTYIGFDKKTIEATILDNEVIVDRAVPAGMALDIGFLWDGVDVLTRLSRFVDVR